MLKTIIIAVAFAALTATTIKAEPIAAPSAIEACQHIGRDTLMKRLSCIWRAARSIASTRTAEKGEAKAGEARSQNEAQRLRNIAAYYRAEGDRTAAKWRGLYGKK